MKGDKVSTMGILFLIGLFFATTACQKLDKLTQFHMEYTDSTTISSIIGVNLPFNVFTPPIKTNASETFEINDTRKDLIEEIKLEDLVLKTIDPENAEFSFLKSIEVYIETEGENETLIAWKYEIDNSVGNTLSLEVTADDLSTYVISDEIILRISTVTDKIILSDIQIEIKAGFFVNAKILGI